MRCNPCQTEPLTPGHFCECCGRKLSLEERKAQETAATAATDRQPSKPTASAARCGSCGGPSEDGEICRSCMQAFGAVLGTATPAASTASASESPRTNASIAQPPSAPQSHAQSYGVVAEMPPASGSALEKSRADAAAAEASRTEAARAEAEKEKARNENVQPAARPKPAPIRIASIPQRRTGMKVFAGLTFVAIAAAGVVMFDAMGGVSQAAAWFGMETPAQMAQVEQAGEPAPVDTVGEAAAGATPPVKRRAAPAPEPAPKRREPAAAPRPASVKTKPASPPVNPTPTVLQVASVVTPMRTPEPLASPAAPAPVSDVAEPRRMAAREVPLGRLFEPTDVDESPKVATRVAPELPRDLGDRSGDVVVVRVLVSQSGHPFRINVLRRSKHGRTADDAVVAAVNQWTFSPAKKRGEAVSCWYNFGVPLGQAD